MRGIFVGSVLGVALAGPTLAAPALTIAPAEMRNAPNPRARVVEFVPANAEIEVRNCGEVWCSASWRDIHGFLPANAASGGPGAPPVVFQEGPPPSPVVVAPFGWGFAYGWGRPWRPYY